MLTKCICTNCAGHLEFEEEDAGQSIPCPHCGLNTILSLPGTRVPGSPLMALARKWQQRRRLIGVAGAVLLLAAFGFGLYRWGIPLVESLVPSIESKLVALLVLALLCLSIPLALFWLVFPVLLFLQLRKLTQVLARMVPSSPAEEFPSAAADGQPDSVEEEEEEAEDREVAEG
jgi:hypothetical protein